MIIYLWIITTITSGSIDTHVPGANCDEIIKTHITSNDFIDRCHRVAEYLHYIKDKEDLENRCKCLNYLLNTKIEYNTFPKKKCSELFDAYEAISDNLKTCKLTIGCINKVDLEQIKKKYYLNEAIKKLEKSIEDNDENIYSTSEEFAQLYTNSIGGCKSDNTEGYCGAIRDLEVLCYHHVKSKNCAEIAKLIQYQEALKKSVKIVIPCIMILGIPFFFYILHKFTPFGSWFNNFLIKNKIIRHNINEEVTDGIFEHTNETNGRNSTHSLCYIGYPAT
ncbi:PIR Superfamily Protein [Plasmodium ovale wallikeri]|uniref:PIR Superfamily Protein n=1 Tax=Plasmodium ovale wallikeri TaxID=864142 RepID=A0A1A9AML1_PLAOA|nr:PIR Superfamily Protein [Plasmodium ovale wallikeri]